MEPEEKGVEVEALVRSMKESFEIYVKLNKKIPPEMLMTVSSIDKPSRLADTIVSHLNLKLEDKQRILEILKPKERLELSPMVFKEIITVPTITLDDWAQKYAIDHVDFIWLIYLIHVFAYIYGLIQLPRSNFTKLAGAVVIISHFLQILTVPMFPDLPQRNMAYRYICWEWIGWAALYASALTNGTKTSTIFNKAMIVGIISQIYILITIEGTRF